jgi:hypothetical protein
MASWPSESVYDWTGNGRYSMLLRDCLNHLLVDCAGSKAAVAHKILVAVYQIFSQLVCYNELGDLYLDKLNKHHLTRNLVHRLERLGYIVTLEQIAA